MAELVVIRRLTSPDLAAYKALRDDMLAAHPEAFTSDAAAERERSADSYLSRLGIDRTDRTDCTEGGQFTLGAWLGQRLVGAISCERDLRVKVRHVAHLIGMMVCADVRHAGIGHALSLACIAAARSAEGVTILTLSVTATPPRSASMNAPASRATAACPAPCASTAFPTQKTTWC